VKPKREGEDSNLGGNKSSPKKIGSSKFGYNEDLDEPDMGNDI
jgi:hypothetical protein